MDSENKDATISERRLGYAPRAEDETSLEEEAHQREAVETDDVRLVEEESFSDQEEEETNAPTMTPAPQSSTNATTHVGVAPQEYGEIHGEPVVGRPVIGQPIYTRGGDYGGYYEDNGATDADDGDTGIELTTVVATDPATGEEVYIIVPQPRRRRAGESADDLSALRSAEHMSLTWRMGRTIKMYSIADFIIVILVCFAWPWFAFLLPFPIVGFMGALRFYPVPTLVYLLYFPLVIAGRIYVTYYTVNKTEDGTIEVINVVLGILGVLLELYCCRLVSVFYRQLRTLTADERLELRTGAAQTDRRFVWW